MKSFIIILWITLVTTFFCSLTASAQTSSWRDYLEVLAEEGTSAEIVENLFNELEQLEVNPMNLNTVTKGQLERFPLLSPEQATALYDYLTMNRPIYTVYELRNVYPLDFNTVERLLPFFMAEKAPEKSPRLNEMLKGGRNELQVRLDKTLNRRAGYQDYAPSILEKYPNRKYTGEDFYSSTRYSFAWEDRLQAGVTVEKDAGERIDHYGFHLLTRDLGALKGLVIGDYRLTWGQGLVLNNDFATPKSWGMNRLARQTQVAKRHFSTAEYGYFRGVASTVKVGMLELSTFYSNKKIDGNLSDTGEITSFKTDGYHRTPGERAKKNNTRERVTGANLNYKGRQLQVGFSGIYYAYDRKYNPRLKLYNLYDLRDSTNVNVGVDYSYRVGNVSFAGETATGKNGAVATVNMVQYAPSSELNLMGLYRYYPVRYNGLYANGFKEGGEVKNERGFYLGAAGRPFRKVRMEMYADVVRFPWPKYNVDRPSDGVDLYFLGAYSMRNESDVEVRYKYKSKEKNGMMSDGHTKTVLPYETHKLRLRYERTRADGWNFRTTLDGALYKERDASTEKGFMVSQNIGFRGSKRLTGDCFAGYFDSDGYSARLYSYERNLMNSFYMPSFYGQGCRLSLSAKLALSDRLSLAVKGAHTRYFDRDSIGSGTEMISGNRRTDIYSYLRWRF